MLEKQNAARVARDRHRTRFRSTIVTRQKNFGNSILRSMHATHINPKDTDTMGAGQSSRYVDEEIGLHESRTGERRPATGKGDDIEVNRLIAGRCIRLDSKDGRAEGWLRARDSEPGDTGTQTVAGTGDPIASTRGVTLQQLRQDPREILVPDRIWDGKRRSHESPGPSDTPRSSRPRLPPRSISTPFSSEGSSNTFGNVVSSCAAGPST